MRGEVDVSRHADRRVEVPPNCSIKPSISGKRMEAIMEQLSNRRRSKYSRSTNCVTGFLVHNSSLSGGTWSRSTIPCLSMARFPSECPLSIGSLIRVYFIF
jgi:hypothetical protein